jgi:hypothetical protein
LSDLPDWPDLCHDYRTLAPDWLQRAFLALIGIPCGFGFRIIGLQEMVPQALPFGGSLLAYQRPEYEPST